jgi:hypothetical protein
MQNQEETFKRSIVNPNYNATIRPRPKSLQPREGGDSHGSLTEGSDRPQQGLREVGGLDGIQGIPPHTRRNEWVYEGGPEWYSDGSQALYSLTQSKGNSLESVTAGTLNYFCLKNIL